MFFIEKGFRAYFSLGVSKLTSACTEGYSSSEFITMSLICAHAEDVLIRPVAVSVADG